MFKGVSIRIKLLVLLLGYTAVTFLLVYLASWYFNRKQEIYEVTDQLSRIQMDLLKAQSAQNDFLLQDAINTDFFKNESSTYASAHDSISSLIATELSTLCQNPIIERLGHEAEFSNLAALHTTYRETFEKLVKILLIRGFQNYGLEGEMRDYAHRLEEEFSAEIPAADILMLRRHEKDFIIRRDLKYQDKFERQIEHVKLGLLLRTGLPHDRVHLMLELLDGYKASLVQLVAAEKSIGLNESHGLKSEVDQTSKEFIRQVDMLVISISKEQQALLSEMELYFYLALAVFLIVSVVASIILSRNMTVRLAMLKNNLDLFVKSNFKEPSSYPRKIGSDEVGELARNFKVLEDEIVVHFNHYRNKVDKRTEEILMQKEELEKSKVVIERKNKDILDSIKYAKKIQDSILPEERYISQLLPENFILFQPKDIVSGDFYWIERKNNKVFVAIADCTGHGVPGAFMSIIGNNLLNQAVHEKNLEDPELILNYMNVSVSSTLGQNTSEQNTSRIKDGMDIALIVIDFSNNHMKFAGAQRPVVIVRENEVVEFKGDRMPVGGYLFGQYIKFAGHETELKKGDCLYLFSDGYADQFGGEMNKKFKYAKLRELLRSIHSEPMSVQCEILKEAHHIWKGENEQVDDICLVGMRV
jgi:serine phosphatase RsbU (regulator of sigma subunit)